MKALIVAVTAMLGLSGCAHVVQRDAARDHQVDCLLNAASVHDVSDEERDFLIAGCRLNYSVESLKQKPAKELR